MNKYYVLINFKARIYGLVTDSKLDIINLITSIINDDDDEIIQIRNSQYNKQRSNEFQAIQSHQDNGIITTIDITEIGYIEEPKQGSPRYCGIVTEVENGTISTRSLRGYLDNLIREINCPIPKFFSYVSEN